MGLVAVSGDGDPLRRHRHLRRGDVAQFEISGEKVPVAGGEADAQAGQARALRQRVKDDDVFEIRRCFQHARRRPVAVDLAVAFVAEDEKAEATRQGGEFFQIGAVGHRALRVRRRSEIAGDRAREQILAQRIEVGQKSGCRRGRQIYRFAVGGGGAGGVGGIKRIGNEHGRPAGTRLYPSLGGEGCKKEPLAGAVEHQHFACRVDRTLKHVAAIEPGGDRLAEGIEPPVHRIASEFFDVRGDHRRNERGYRMLRFADRHADRGLPLRDVAEKLAQTHERRARLLRVNAQKRVLAGHLIHSSTAGPPAASAPSIA